jgi:putative nucleotidyltransferase with HDIG domain
VGDILLLGQDKDRAGGIKDLLRQDGHGVLLERDIARWRARESEVAPDLVVAAVGSTAPVLAVAGRPVRGFPPPLLFVQHEMDAWRGVDLDERLVDRIESPFTAEDFLGRVDALVRVRRIVLREDSETDTRAQTRGWRGVGGRLAAMLGTRVPKLDKPSAPYLEVAARVADWADRRDGFEPGHAERVAALSAMIANELRLPDDQTASLLRAAMLHDIGKVALPVEVLRERRPLGEDQLRLLRTHAARGARILRALDRDEGVAAAVQYHHERVDGTGYHGKSGEEIPLSAKILAVAEAFDAMTMTRVATPMTSERARSILKDQSGGHFDGPCVDALCEALRPRSRSIPLARY